MTLCFSLGEMSRVHFDFVSADNHERFCALQNWNSGSCFFFSLYTRRTSFSMIPHISLLKNCFLIFPVNSEQSQSLPTEGPNSQGILLYKLTASKSHFQIVGFFFFFAKKTVPQPKSRVTLYYYKKVFRIAQRTADDIAVNLKVY